MLVHPQCQEEWAEWAEWVEWVEWECSPHYTQTKIQEGQFLLPFFFDFKILTSNDN